MRPLRLVLPLLAFWSLACFTGNRRVEQTEYTRTVTQNTAVPAARGPAAAGPLAPAGRVTIEVNGSGAYFQAPTRTPMEGGPGQWTAGDWLGGRAAIGVNDWFELGISGDASPTALAQRTSQHLTALEADWFGRGSLQMRFGPEIGRDVRFVTTIEADVVNAPYERRETVESVTSYYDGEGPPQLDSDAWGDTEVGGRFQGVVRGALAVHGDVGPTTLGGGLSVQTVPVYFGRDEVSWTCTAWEDGTSECTEASGAPPSTTSVLPTVYATAAWRITDGAMILAQPWFTLGRSDDDVAQSAPAGILVGMRFTSPGRDWN